MKINTRFNNVEYEIDLNHFTDISIPIRRNRNVACYGIENPSFDAFRSGNFIADVSRGGSVNCEYIRFNAHGNGTHTENMRHVMQTEHSMREYKPAMNSFAYVITADSNDGHLNFDKKWPELPPGIESLVVRHLPNNEEKMIADYTGTNPLYCMPEDLLKMRRHGIKNLLIDLPSVDPESDGGALAAHKAFFNIPNSPDKETTITELIFVPDTVLDGLYFLQLQIPAIETDAVPSRPLLFNLKETGSD